MFIVLGKKFCLGPLLFNIDIRDLFLMMKDYDIDNCADDDTPYITGKKIEEVVNLLKQVLLSDSISLVIKS